MTYERFEQIPVWQSAIALARLVFVLTGNRALVGQGDLANQLQRAALSISNNVAEGFERGRPMSCWRSCTSLAVRRERCGQ